MQTPKKLFRLAAAIFAVIAIAATQAQAQSVPAADAQAFMGAWTLSVEGMPLQIDIKDQEGQVAAEVEVMGMRSPITEISKADEALLLRYVADLDGQQAPITIRLTPSGENLATVIDVADGMFTANAVATKS